MTRGELLEYLMETLIPDLRDSGKEETANDFQTCATRIMEDGLYMSNLADQLDRNTRPSNEVNTFLQPYLTILRERARR